MCIITTPMFSIFLNVDNNSIICSVKYPELNCKHADDMHSFFNDATKKYRCDVLIVDLKKVIRIDFSIVGVFLNLLKECNRKNIKLYFINVTSEVNKIFTLARVNSFFEIKTTNT